jgi:23S rRNA (cytosine1962-C5)-methyltransferase
VPVTDRKGKFLGQALYSPKSEIRLRLLTRGNEPIDATWWTKHIGDAAERRAGISATAWRAVHAEGDGLPSLIIDKYGSHIVAQLLSAGLETARADVLAAIREVFGATGILLRNDAGVRRHEGLAEEVVLAHGEVPKVVEVMEDGVRYVAAPWTGQKTGAFLDQRENRILIGKHTRTGGRALDLFTYHGSFALHLARNAKEVLAVDQSAEALARGAENAKLNGTGNINWSEANAFDLLRELERRREQFDTIVLDPPAFAKTKANIERAVAGYKEINLRAMKILAPGGVLFTSSCSYHVSRDVFNAMLADAARDSGRRIQFLAATGAAGDHPELLNVPETGYLKGALLRALA